MKEKAREDAPLELSLMKVNTSLYVGIYYLQWRLVELPTSITRRLIAVYIYDAHSSPKIQNSFCEVVHSRRIAAR